MKEKEILEIFIKTKAILKGHFILSSGKHSSEYMQCAKVLEYPEYAKILCTELAKKFSNEKIDTVIAPAIGGIIVSYEVASALNVRSLFTERVEEKMILRRGFELKKDEKVLIVEDVITTGLSTNEVVKTIKGYGLHIVGVGCLVDRSKGKVAFGPRFESLIKVDIPAFDPKDCPLCKTGTPAIKPGSRK